MNIPFSTRSVAVTNLSVEKSVIFRIGILRPLVHESKEQFSMMVSSDRSTASEIALGRLTNHTFRPFTTYRVHIVIREKSFATYRILNLEPKLASQEIADIYQCFSLMSTVLISTPSLNQRSSSEISTSLPLICLFLIRPSGAYVES